MTEETYDVDGDGTEDTVTYEDANNDGYEESVSVDLGSDGTEDVSAEDTDNSGVADHYEATDPTTGETYAVDDVNEDGVADGDPYATA